MRSADFHFWGSKHEVHETKQKLEASDNELRAGGGGSAVDEDR